MAVQLKSTLIIFHSGADENELNRIEPMHIARFTQGKMDFVHIFDEGLPGSYTPICFVLILMPL